MYFENNQNVGNLLLFVVSHVVVKMAESFATNTVSRFRSPKTASLQESREKRPIVCVSLVFLNSLIVV